MSHSLTLDADLMEAADLLPYEQVHVLDVDNRARLVTYCIEGPRGTGTVCVNGAAARSVFAGDKIIVKVGFQGVDDADAMTRGDVNVLIDVPRRVGSVVSDRG